MIVIRQLKAQLRNVSESLKYKFFTIVTRIPLYEEELFA